MDNSKQTTANNHAQQPPEERTQQLQQGQTPKLPNNITSAPTSPDSTKTPPSLLSTSSSPVNIQPYVDNIKPFCGLYTPDLYEPYFPSTPPIFEPSQSMDEEYYDDEYDDDEQNDDDNNEIPFPELASIQDTYPLHDQ